MGDYLYTISAFFMTFEDFFKDTKTPRFRGVIDVGDERLELLINKWD